MGKCWKRLKTQKKKGLHPKSQSVSHEQGISHAQGIVKTAPSGSSANSASLSESHSPGLPQDGCFLCLEPNAKNLWFQQSKENNQKCFETKANWIWWPSHNQQSTCFCFSPGSKTSAAESPDNRKPSLPWVETGSVPVDAEKDIHFGCKHVDSWVASCHQGSKMVKQKCGANLNL